MKAMIIMVLIAAAVILANILITKEIINADIPLWLWLLR